MSLKSTLRVLITTLALVGTISLSGCTATPATPPDPLGVIQGHAPVLAFTPPPTPAEVAAAKKYLADHAADKVEIPSNDIKPAAKWVRAIVLQVAADLTAEPATWAAKVLLADGTTADISAKVEDAAPMATSARPGAYITYFRPDGDPLLNDDDELLKDRTVKVIAGKAVTITGVPSASPSASRRTEV